MTVHADQYPYIAGSTTLLAFFPEWCHAGGKAAFSERLKTADTRRRMIADMIDSWSAMAQRSNRAGNIYIARFEPQPEYEGKSLLEICNILGRKPTLENGIRLALELVAEDEVRIIDFYGNETDLVAFMKDPSIMIGTDGTVVPFGEGVPHPRYYGTYPRILGRYVREKKLLSLEEAIRKMTSLPAKAFCIANRGILKAGNAGDIVIFHPETIIDNATFQQPHQYPTGIQFVIVNGRIVVENGMLTGNRPGKAIRRHQ
jgi:N-acyl-D-amino-acid deacylase